MAENLLEVRDLTITPAGARAPVLENVSLSLAPGERVGLIGESGSGKSLTAQSVMGLLPEELHAEGSVSLQGFSGNILEAKEKTLARMRSNLVSMVFQEPMSALNPLMRIGDQIAEALRIHGAVARGDIPRRVLDLLTSVHMPDPGSARSAYPHQMSGGQRQRVMLAIALANSPQLLICDEPTTALDVTVQKHMLELIAERVAAVQAGLLFITHDLAVVAEVCERVIVMYAGRIVESGTVRQIFTDPQHEYTRGLLASSDLEATDGNGKLYTLKTALSYAGPVDETSPVDEAGPGDEDELSVAAGAADVREPAAVRESRAASASEARTVGGVAPLIEVSGVSKHFRSRGSAAAPQSPGACA